MSPCEEYETENKAVTCLLTEESRNLQNARNYTEGQYYFSISASLVHTIFRTGSGYSVTSPEHFFIFSFLSSYALRFSVNIFHFHFRYYKRVSPEVIFTFCGNLRKKSIFVYKITESFKYNECVYMYAQVKRFVRE